MRIKGSAIRGIYTRTTVGTWDWRLGEKMASDLTMRTEIGVPRVKAYSPRLGLTALAALVVGFMIGSLPQNTAKGAAPLAILIDWSELDSGPHA